MNTKNSRVCKGGFILIFVFVISDDGRSIICEIYDKHYKRMLYTATQILGQERGEDAVHDVFVKLIDKFENNSENYGDKPGQYFVIIVRNHSLNILKKDRLDFLPFPEELSDQDIFRSSVADPEETLLGNEAVERLVSLIRRLTPATRQVLEYRFIEGYSNIEIAEILGISQSAVSSRIDKAKKRLRELLEREGADQ
jgi:RNA polymerase sigma-70 factor (ECF subfamily)